MKKSEKKRIFEIRHVLESLAHDLLDEGNSFAVELQDCADNLFEIANHRDTNHFAMLMAHQMANNILQDYERGFDHGDVLICKATFFQETTS